MVLVTLDSIFNARLDDLYTSKIVAGCGAFDVGYDTVQELGFWPSVENGP